MVLPYASLLNVDDKRRIELDDSFGDRISREGKHMSQEPSESQHGIHSVIFL
jgi:hypothetical protein